MRNLKLYTSKLKKKKRPILKSFNIFFKNKFLKVHNRIKKKFQKFFKLKFKNIIKNKYIIHNYLIYTYKKNFYLKYLKKKNILKINRKIFITYKNFLKKNKKKFIQSSSITYFNFNLYQKVLTFIFKIGKKNIWENKISQIFEQLALTLKISKSAILLKIFIRLFTRVEILKIKARKRITFIPIFIKINRSIFLSLKWIFLASKKKKGSTSFSNNLFFEILQILTQKICFSLQKVQENNTLAFKNRSNVHFRWKKTR
jgi:ribosomal protein S7